jgi:hypothetical protein
VILEDAAKKDFKNVLPLDYQVESGSGPITAPSLNEIICRDEYEQLIQNSTLAVDSFYFSSHGTINVSFQKTPFHHSFVKTLSRPTSIKNYLEPYAIKSALETYTTNLEKMWQKNKQVSLLLDHLFFTKSR